MQRAGQCSRLAVDHAQIRQGEGVLLREPVRRQIACDMLDRLETVSLEPGKLIGGNGRVAPDVGGLGVRRQVVPCAIGVLQRDLTVEPRPAHEPRLVVLRVETSPEIEHPSGERLAIRLRGIPIEPQPGCNRL